LGFEDEARRDRHRLGNLIGPVLCRSAEEQTNFHRIFNHWFPREEPNGAANGGQVQTSRVFLQVAEERKAAVSEAEKLLREANRIAFRHTLRLVILLTVLLLGLSFI